ncbi:hypothetical protein GFY24_05380 [Nocardia sp. SYP-A9097]|nr:hypothetical protein [Nocardia sp. SYP-A9097]
MRRSTGCPFAPPQAVRELAATGPVAKVQIWDGQQAWLVTGYDEARSLFGDARVSVDGALPGFPHLNEGMKALAAMAPRTMFNTDGEEHARYRRMLTKPFMIKRLDALKPVIQKYIDEHIDLMLDSGTSADLVAALALPVPSLAICELLGVPYADHAFFQRSSAVGFSGDTSGVLEGLGVPVRRRDIEDEALARAHRQLADRVEFKLDSLVHGVRALPVEW